MGSLPSKFIPVINSFVESLCLSPFGPREDPDSPVLSLVNDFTCSCPNGSPLLQNPSSCTDNGSTTGRPVLDSLIYQVKKEESGRLEDDHGV